MECSQQEISILSSAQFIARDFESENEAVSGSEAICWLHEERERCVKDEVSK